MTLDEWFDTEIRTCKGENTNCFNRLSYLYGKNKMNVRVTRFGVMDGKYGLEVEEALELIHLGGILEGFAMSRDVQRDQKWWGIILDRLAVGAIRQGFGRQEDIDLLAGDDGAVVRVRHDDGEIDAKIVKKVVGDAYAEKFGDNIPTIDEYNQFVEELNTTTKQ